MARHSFISRLLVLGLLLGWGVSLPWSSVALAATPRAAATPWQPGQITQYHLPKGFRGPWAIVTGPDGNLWFTEEYDNGRAGDKIGKITTQ